MHIAVAQEIENLLKPSLNALCSALCTKVEAFKDIIKIGRTHLQVSNHQWWRFSIQNYLGQGVTILLVHQVQHHLLEDDYTMWREIFWVLCRKSNAFVYCYLQDAVPLTLGQEFGAYLHQVQTGIERIDATMSHLYELAAGILAFFLFMGKNLGSKL